MIRFHPKSCDRGRMNKTLIIANKSILQHLTLTDIKLSKELLSRMSDGTLSPY